MDYNYLFSSEYLMPLYYFCLKKTGDVHQAEELTSEISLEVLIGLNKKIPEHFSAWVWQIARNRYSRWAIHKRSRIDTEFAVDICGLDEIPDSDDIESIYVHKDELAIMRRELAFIQSDYRNILIAYYINDRKVNDIAHELSLPEGTVKTRLFYGRNKLKEGMNMAREFGKRSYCPENVNFCASGRQGKAPWGYVDRKISKNILLEAHNNPSTIEELSLELGVAVPYMEEEIALLEEGELICRINKNKYVTNFYIASSDVQLAIYNIMHMDSNKRYELLSKILKDSIKDIRKLGIIHDEVNDNEFKWLLYPRIIDLMNQEIKGYGIWDVFHHKDGNNWGFIGFEASDIIPKSPGLSQNGNGDGVNMIWVYAFGSFGFERRIQWIDPVKARLLIDIIRNRRIAEDLSASERNILEGMKGFLYHVDDTGIIIPHFSVFERNSYERMMSIVKSHLLYNELMKMQKDLYLSIKQILKSDSIPLLHKYMDYYASMFFCTNRIVMVTDAVNAGELIAPDNPEYSAAGIYMDLV